jgi:hypothetical protein
MCVLSLNATGFARVDNTEFYHTGQEGWYESYDARYSLAFIDVLNNPATGFYSYVRNNTFHNGFSPAVGVYAVPNLEVSGNVIHHVINFGMLFKCYLCNYFEVSSFFFALFTPSLSFKYT